MARTEKTELTNLCLITRGDEILLQNRVKGGWTGWTLPGGHVEPNESIVESVRREVKEETGLTVENPMLCGVKQFPIEGGRYIVFLFRADRFSGEITSSEEGEMRWFKRNDIPSLRTTDDLLTLITLMEDEQKSEFQYIPDGSDWALRLF